MTAINRAFTIMCYCPTYIAWPAVCSLPCDVCPSPCMRCMCDLHLVRDVWFSPRAVCSSRRAVGSCVDTSRQMNILEYCMTSLFFFGINYSYYIEMLVTSPASLSMRVSVIILTLSSCQWKPDSSTCLLKQRLRVIYY